MTTTETHTVRVSCCCDTCRANATKLGATFPLAAMIRPEAATILKITAKNSDAPRLTHGIVYMAHDPQVGPYQNMAVAVS